MAPLTRLAADLPATVPFIGPEQHERERGALFDARLGANESTFGPSPRAVEALLRAAPEIWKYPDAQSFDLRKALADHLEIGMDHIVVGAGIDGLLGSLVRLTVAPGDAVVTSDGAYPTFAYHVAGYGGVLHKVPYRNDREDPDALIDALHRTGARLVYLANPDNPMGTWHEAARVADFISRLPEGCLLVLDEAYLECSARALSPPLGPDDPRVIRMRTFSKAYGLAGARIGYAIGERSLIAAFDKVRNHFGVSRPSQVAALAALRDGAYLGRVRHLIEASRTRIAALGRAHGLVPIPSATNFVALDLGRDGAHTRAVVAELMRRGVFVRSPAVPPLARCLRISCGTDADMDLLDQALPAALAAIG